MIGLPLGAIIPFCGYPDRLPKGFLLVDSRNRWPNAAWVPGHLRGQPMPDMTHEVLIGGTSDSSAIGQVMRVADQQTDSGLKSRNRFVLTLDPSKVPNLGLGCPTGWRIGADPQPFFLNEGVPTHLMCHWIVRVE